jgi:hypothetical protein
MARLHRAMQKDTGQQTGTDTEGIHMNEIKSVVGDRIPQQQSARQRRPDPGQPTRGHARGPQHHGHRHQPGQNIPDTRDDQRRGGIDRESCGQVPDDKARAIEPAELLTRFA